MSTPAITSFTGKYAFLSNFFEAGVFLDDLSFDTVEHAYQAAKSLDLVYRWEIRRTHSPAFAKRLGQQVKKRADWESVKVPVMTGLVREKFAIHPELAKKLMATGTASLIEGNTWGDTFWGEYEGAGENHLGKILMQVRDELRGEDLIG
jgi:ribA/ribD-fused uncharacterized protein